MKSPKKVSARKSSAAPAPTPAPPRTTRHSARTLSIFVREARLERKLSQRALAHLAKIDPSMICKLEAGYHGTRGRVRAESLASVLRALGWREGDPDYARAFALWTTEHHERAHRTGHVDSDMVEARFDAATSGRDAERERLRRACEEALEQLPAELWPDMLAALKNHRALRLWIESANALTGQR